MTTFFDWLKRWAIKLPRPEQLEADRAYATCASKLFLLCGLPGFGKTSTVYKLIARTKGPVLVVSRIATTMHAWDNDCSNWLRYRRWLTLGFWPSKKFHRLTREDSFEGLNREFGDGDVVWGTVQLLAHGKRQGEDAEQVNRKVLERYPNILNQKWALVIFDECHNGASVNSGTQTLLNLGLKAEAFLLVSATPYTYTASERYEFTYLQQAEVRQRELRTFMFLGFSETTSAKLARWIALRPFGSFFFPHVWAPEIRICDIEGLPTDRIATLKILRQRHGHILVMLEKGIEALKEFAGELRAAGEDVFAATGDNEGEGSDTLEIAQSFIEEHPHGSIVLVGGTGGKLTCSVTVPEWNAAVFFCPDRSLQNYIQAAYRVQRENKPARKTTCYIYDFVESRKLQVLSDWLRVDNKHSLPHTPREAVDRLTTALGLSPKTAEKLFGQVDEYTRLIRLLSDTVEPLEAVAENMLKRFPRDHAFLPEPMFCKQPPRPVSVYEGADNGSISSDENARRKLVSLYLKLMRAICELGIDYKDVSNRTKFLQLVGCTFEQFLETVDDWKYSILDHLDDNAQNSHARLRIKEKLPLVEIGQRGRANQLKWQQFLDGLGWPCRAYAYGQLSNDVELFYETIEKFLERDSIRYLEIAQELPRVFRPQVGWRGKENRGTGIFAQPNVSASGETPKLGAKALVTFPENLELPIELLALTEKRNKIRGHKAIARQEMFWDLIEHGFRLTKFQDQTQIRAAIPEEFQRFFDDGAARREFSATVMMSVLD